MDFFQRNRAQIVADENGMTAQAAEPFDHVLGVGHAAAQEQQLGFGRGQSQSQLIIQPAVLIAEHLILIDDQQSGTVALNEPVLLRLQRGHQDGSVKILGQIAGGDADIPAAGAPLGQFVIGQGAGGNGVNGLAPVFALIGPEPKMSVLPAPVGAWTTTSQPCRSAVTACCCQRSGMVTVFKTRRFSSCSVIVPMPER